MPFQGGECTQEGPTGGGGILNSCHGAVQNMPPPPLKMPFGQTKGTGGTYPIFPGCNESIILMTREAPKGGAAMTWLVTSTPKFMTTGIPVQTTQREGTKLTNNHISSCYLVEVGTRHLGLPVSESGKEPLCLHRTAEALHQLPCWTVVLHS